MPTKTSCPPSASNDGEPKRLGVRGRGVGGEWAEYDKL